MTKLLLPQQSPVRRRKIYEEIVDRLEVMMLDGTLSPGDVLPAERELMESFQVGRSSIREALFALQRMGLISIRNGERAYVTKPSADAVVNELGGVVKHLLARPEGARDLQRARAMHEVSLARYAARHATEEDLQALKAALDANREAMGNVTAFTRTDVQFHLVLAKIPNNSIFTSLHSALAAWLSEQRTTSLQVAGADEAAYEAHEAIYRAISSRDPDAAERAMQGHLEEVGAYYWHGRGKESGDK
ncbi:transcriptional regulator NanR [Variovorax ureilyticus]|uniref:Transcriptional regulator NanR n=1 Tax=Variovorax ureilyticus TaxID=1836198 RepID=A0ABU8VR93_9BURK